MKKTQRTPVRITEEHLEDYLKIVEATGSLGNQALLQVQHKYSMPLAHTREGVLSRLRPMLQEKGIVLHRSKKQVKAGDGHKIREEIIPAMQVEMEPVSLAWEPTQSALFTMMLQARVAQKLAIRVQQLEEDNKKLNEENQRIYQTERYKQQWEQAVQQGDINPPIGLPGKADLVADFTYHI